MSGYGNRMEWKDSSGDTDEAQLQQRLGDALMLVSKKDQTINDLTEMLQAKDDEVVRLRDDALKLKDQWSREKEHDCQRIECCTMKEQLQQSEKTLNDLLTNPCKRVQCQQAKENLERTKSETMLCLRTGCQKTHVELQQMKAESARISSQQCRRPECERAKKTATQLSQKNDQLKREKEKEQAKAEDTMDANKAEIETLKSQLDAKPCRKGDCRRTRESLQKHIKERDQEKEHDCQRIECCTMKEQLQQSEKTLNDLLTNPCKRVQCQQAKENLERTKSETMLCLRTGCQKTHIELQQMKAESARISSQQCRRSGCERARKTATQLSQENDQLKREKEKEQAKAKDTMDANKAEIETLKSQLDAKPCRKGDCRRTRESLQKHIKERDQEQAAECKRETCVWRKREMQDLRKKIDKMERQPCNSHACQNAYGKKILGVLGEHNLSEGSHEVTMTQALEHIDKKLSLLWDRVGGTSGPTQEHLQLGQCQNEECLKIKRSLERKVQELESSLHAEKCHKPECAKLRRDLKQKELAEMGKSGNIGTNLQKMTGAEHSELIHDFEAVTTNPDGILGELEDVVDAFSAKRVLSKIFQLAYDNCKEMVVVRICQKLETLFTVNREADREDMEDTSRGYGLLLHGAGLKTEKVIAENVSAVAEKVCLEFSQSHKIYDKVKTILQPGNPLLNHVVRLTWKFITLPSPLIICQPATFSEQIHEPEFGYWDKSVRPTKLIYTRPVVYRSYQGILACKAWVANTAKSVETQNEEQESKSLLSMVTGALGFS